MTDTQERSPDRKKQPECQDNGPGRRSAQENRKAGEAGETARRHIRSFVRRERGISERQKEQYAELARSYCIPVPDAPFDPRCVFTGQQGTPAETLRTAKPGKGPVLSSGKCPEIILDIGFGYGENLLMLAREYPHISFLGVEVNKQCMYRVMRACADMGLNNIRLMHYDAVDLVNTRIYPGKISAVHLFFPDPWPKKRHHKRRMINAAYIAQLRTILADDAYVYIVSDWEHYVVEIRKHFAESGHFVPRSKAVDKAAGWWRPSAYEKKAAGRKIFHLLYDAV